MRERRSAPRIWLAPVLLGVVTAIGLAAPLGGGELRTAAGWIALAVPVGVVVWALWPKAGEG